jgi:hypothetical protein
LVNASTLVYPGVLAFGYAGGRKRKPAGVQIDGNFMGIRAGFVLNYAFMGLALWTFMVGRNKQGAVKEVQ